MGFAYWSAEAGTAMLARESPRFARIMAAGPWQFRDYDHDGKHGVIAQWKGVTEESYGTPRLCSDGLWYFPAGAALTIASLAKDNVPTGIDVDLSTGVTLTIPLALAAPRLLTFGDDDGLGAPASEFATLADQVFERLRKKEPVTLRDKDVRRLVVLAVQQSYRVTDEVLTELRWITTLDVDPILCAIMGSDPKASPDANATSPSPASGSPVSP